MKEVKGNDYLIRLFDQSDSAVPYSRIAYASISKDDWDSIIEMLEIKEDDWT